MIFPCLGPVLERAADIAVRSGAMDLVSTDGKPGFFAIGQEAVGVIAIGQTALGVFALGQQARGVIAIGQMAIGVVALGQLSIGALWSTGMVGLAGPYGYGLVLHTVPRIFLEKNPDVHDASPAARLEDGSLKIGHLAATIGEAGITLDEMHLAVDTSAVTNVLTDAKARNFDRVMLTVDVVEDRDATGYREAKVTRRLVARSATAFWSSPPKRLAYAKPLGGGGMSLVTTHVVLRTLGGLVLFGLVAVFAIAPLVEMLFF